GAGAARLTVEERAASTIETKLSVNLQRELRRFTDAPDLPSETNDVVSTTWSWTRRAVDELTDPRRGTVLSYALTAGLRREFIESLAANTFARGWLRAKIYLPFPGLDPADNVLIVRGELGRVFVDNPSFVPNEFLFRTGGADSLRGYAYQSIGRPPGSARAGSTALAIGSIEAVHWFGPQWGGALFFDIGDAADDFDQMRKPARAAGVGVRWKTLAGPIAFDFAYGERRPDNTGGRWRLHFSVAIAF
ncbi:MAG TPA: BamA/TamA family outer membrane protein, partial [Burkholderiaceae bacterium]|nr:BamA/TamA family outer membrane protein [Burkholderiaceae bacterium]